MALPALIQTARLRLRLLRAEDAAFILALVNDPAWLRFIGDRHIRDHVAAERYITRCHAMHEQHGVGLLAVEAAATGEVVGICGLLQREKAADLDLGFAFLERFRRQGFAREAAAAMLEFGHGTLRRERVLALVHPNNDASIALLTSLGFRFEAARPNHDGTADTHVFVHRTPLA
jgi:[ribosomal protein S5]-alanine N-acetyltransferase